MDVDDGGLVTQSGTLDLGQSGILEVKLLEEAVPEQVEESLVVLGRSSDGSSRGLVLGGDGLGGLDVLSDGGLLVDSGGGRGSGRGVDDNGDRDGSGL